MIFFLVQNEIQIFKKLADKQEVAICEPISTTISSSLKLGIYIVIKISVGFFR